MHFDERRPEFKPYGLTCERWEPHRMPRADRHNEVELNFIEGGSITYLLWGKRVKIEGGTLAAFWAAVPHQIVDFSDIDLYFVVTAPLAWVLDWNLPTAFTQQLVNGHLIQDHNPDALTSDANLMKQWQLDLESNNNERREIMLLELQARLRRMASLESITLSSVSTGSQSKPSPGSKAEVMAGFIAQNYHNQISIMDIANTVGLHPDYATALFKRTYGATPSRFLLDHRIQHAQRMLTVTNEKVLTISIDSGFNSLSRFNAAFKSYCGLTPRQYRLAQRGS